MARKIVCFDFDGVIAHTADISFEVNRVYTPGLTREEYRRRFDGNIFDCGAVKELEKKYPTHIKDFFGIYGPKLMELPCAPGVPELVRGLARRGYVLTIISSSLRDLIARFLEKHDLAHHFADILGAEEGRRKTHKLRAVCLKYSVSPKNCIMITDSLGDMREARRVCVPSIGVTGGVHPEERLWLGEPYAVARNAKELFDFIEWYFGGF